MKELVLAALLLGSRGIVQGINYCPTDLSDAQAMSKLLEQERSAVDRKCGKTLGVIGLGSIGSQGGAYGLGNGMEVLGYDPALSVDAAWRLPSEVRKMENLQSLMAKSDFVTLHFASY